MRHLHALTYTDIIELLEGRALRDVAAGTFTDEALHAERRHREQMMHLLAEQKRSAVRQTEHASKANSLLLLTGGCIALFAMSERDTMQALVLLFVLVLVTAGLYLWGTTSWPAALAVRRGVRRTSYARTRRRRRHDGR